MNPKPILVNTEVFAKLNAVKPTSVRSRYCLTGSYFEHIPQKLCNGKLLWDVSCMSEEQLTMADLGK